MIKYLGFLVVLLIIVENAVSQFDDVSECEGNNREYCHICKCTPEGDWQCTLYKGCIPPTGSNYGNQGQQPSLQKGPNDENTNSNVKDRLKNSEDEGGMNSKYKKSNESEIDQHFTKPAVRLLEDSDSSSKPIDDYIKSDGKKYPTSVNGKGIGSWESSESHYSEDSMWGPPQQDYEDFCLEDATKGPNRCRAYIRKWTFDRYQGKCVKFIYGGCGGTRNLFETEEDCKMSCGTAPKVDRPGAEPIVRRQVPVNAILQNLLGGTRKAGSEPNLRRQVPVDAILNNLLKGQRSAGPQPNFRRQVPVNAILQNLLGGTRKAGPKPNFRGQLPVNAILENLLGGKRKADKKDNLVSARIQDDSKYEEFLEKIKGVFTAFTQGNINLKEMFDRVGRILKDSVDDEYDYIIEKIWKLATELYGRTSMDEKIQITKILTDSGDHGFKDIIEKIWKVANVLYGKASNDEIDHIKEIIRGASPIGIKGRSLFDKIFDYEDFCLEDAEKGPIRCETLIPRWTFDRYQGKCVKYFYGGCKGTRNLFKTEEECKAICGYTPKIDLSDFDSEY